MISITVPYSSTVGLPILDMDALLLRQARCRNRQLAGIDKMQPGASGQQWLGCSATIADFRGWSQGHTGPK